MIISLRQFSFCALVVFPLSLTAQFGQIDAPKAGLKDWRLIPSVSAGPSMSLTSSNLFGYTDNFGFYLNGGVSLEKKEHVQLVETRFRFLSDLSFLRSSITFTGTYGSSYYGKKEVKIGFNSLAYSFSVAYIPDYELQHTLEVGCSVWLFTFGQTNLSDQDNLYARNPSGTATLIYLNDALKSITKKPDLYIHSGAKLQFGRVFLGLRAYFPISNQFKSLKEAYEFASFKQHWVNIHLGYRFGKNLLSKEVERQ